MMRRENTELATREAAPRNLFEEFDRIFDDFRTGLEDVFWTPTLSPLLPTWGSTGVRQAVVDLADTGKEFVVTAELPGVRKEDLDVDVTEDGVAIRAEVRREDERKEPGRVYQERTYSAWYRRVPFPAEVLPDDAEAELRDGVLSLGVPKKEPTPEKKGRKVPVK